MSPSPPAEPPRCERCKERLPDAQRHGSGPTLCRRCKSTRDRAPIDPERIPDGKPGKAPDKAG